MGKTTGLVVLVLALVSGASAHAQDARLAEALAHRAQVLEARLTRRPTARDRCELGFVYLRQARTADAARTLDAAIAELAAASSAADRRTLAMCLFSRARTAEAANDAEHARVFYVRSLELREARETRERVEALAIRSRPADPDAQHAMATLTPEEQAAAALGARDDGTASTVVIGHPTSVGPARWSIVGYAGTSAQECGMAAVVCEAGGCHAAAIDDDTTFNGWGEVTVRSFVVHDGALPVLEVRTYETAHERLDGEPVDTYRRAMAYFCAYESAALTCRSVLVRDELDPVTFDVTYADGSVTVHRVAGRVPEHFEVPLDRPIPVRDLP